VSLKVERIMVQLSGSSLEIQRLRKRQISSAMHNQTASKSKLLLSVIAPMLIAMLALFLAIAAIYIALLSGSR
jgi:hypothetical protein